MKNRLFQGLYLLLLLSGVACSSIESESDSLFELMPSDSTGITFVNKLTEGPNTNILVYEYFFNGGGVAVADFNNDGLEDLYFTSNMADNKLYINQGNLKFKDVTSLSGASGRVGPWKTGVSVVDINADGLLDIYLSYSGALPSEKRKNQLFINLGSNSSGNPTFQELAAQYGLDLDGYSNQAYFFDYDMDGDLDMLMLNHNPKNLPILNVAGTKSLQSQDDRQMGLRLLRNENEKFVDVTLKSGINGSPLSYGLGVAISDYNGDGFPDFYVSNDYTAPDYLYINTGKGSFINETDTQMGHTSMFSMGSDVADVNNDGWVDLLTLDMLPEGNKRQKLLLAPDNFSKFDLNAENGLGYQYMRNMLQLNNGNGTFSEIGQQLGISNTDWSWSALFADFNNDGWKDLYVTNGYFKDYTNRDYIKYMNSYVQEKGRLSREGVLELVEAMPASNVVNYLFMNTQGESFLQENWGGEIPSNSNGAAYSDLDNDGDLDLIVNNINQPAFILKNQSNSSNSLRIKLEGEGKNKLGIGAKVSIWVKGQKQVLEQHLGRGYLSSVSPILHFGVGGSTDVDSLQILWPSGKYQMLKQVSSESLLVLKESDAVPSQQRSKSEHTILVQNNLDVSYKHKPFGYRDFDRQPLLLDEFSHSGPILAVGDLNRDGFDDVFIGGGYDQAPELMLTNSQGQLTKNQQLEDAIFEKAVITSAVINDFNKDGIPEIAVTTGGYHNYEASNPSFGLHLFMSNGSQYKHVRTVLSEVAFSSLSAIDFDNDGDLDLFAGAGVIPGRFPEAGASMLFENDGNGNFTQRSMLELGIVTDIEVFQDANGRNCMVAASQWQAPKVFTWQQNKLLDVTNEFFQNELSSGLWNCVKVADLNGDKKPDFLFGNRGLNSQLKASENEPLILHYGDYDENGTIDPILNFYIDGVSYPYITKEELGIQMPSLNAQFNTFESFSEISSDELFSNYLVEQEKLSVTDLETTCFLSTENGYITQKLPKEVQYAPIYSIEVITHSEMTETPMYLLFLGNNSHTQLKLGKSDANMGCLLEITKDGNWKYIPQYKSGLKLKGDIRSSAILGEQVLIGVNGQNLKRYVFQTNKK